MLVPLAALPGILSDCAESQTVAMLLFCPWIFDQCSFQKEKDCKDDEDAQNRCSLQFLVLQFDFCVFACFKTHGFDLYELRDANGYQPFKIQMDREVDRVFFISRNGMEYYWRTFATRGAEVYRLNYLGTENDLPFVPHSYSDEIELLSVSNVVPVKRVHLIVEALVECAALGIKINWTHIGDGTEMQDVRTLARERLSEGSVSFRFLGQKSNAEVHEYYRGNRADLFVNMSESEGLPVSMMEAMGYGVPVAAPNVGGIGKIVDADSGWLLSKDCCQSEFVCVIKSWSGMGEDERQRKARRAYDKWNAMFNAEKNYMEFAEAMKINY